MAEARLCALVRCCSGKLSLESLDTDCACAVLRAASCAELCLADLRLGGRTTRALVAAMSAGVGAVHLGRGGEVSLHMETLARYSGRGACCSLQLWYGTWTRSVQYSTVQYSSGRAPGVEREARLQDVEGEAKAEQSRILEGVPSSCFICFATNITNMSFPT